MRILLHSNGSAAPEGGVSPQLIARVQRASSRYWEMGDEWIERIYFFGKDRYPCGIHAHEYVEGQLTEKKKILHRTLVIKPIARSTSGEIQAFIDHLQKDGYHGAIASVTSAYNERRVRTLFAQRGRSDVHVYTTPSAGFRDLISEPLKYVRDCGIFGSRAEFA